MYIPLVSAGTVGGATISSRADDRGGDGRRLGPPVLRSGRGQHAHRHVNHHGGSPAQSGQRIDHEAINKGKFLNPFFLR